MASPPKGGIFLLHAVWQNKKREYQHRVVVSRCEKPEDMMLSFAKERKEWTTTTDPYDVGWIDGHLASVTVFKIAKTYPEDMWDGIREKLRDTRREDLDIAERERDLETIRTLVEKHGLNAMEVLAMAAEENSK